MLRPLTEASRFFTDATFESYNLSSKTTRCTQARYNHNSATCPQVAKLPDLPALGQDAPKKARVFN